MFIFTNDENVVSKKLATFLWRKIVYIESVYKIDHHEVTITIFQPFFVVET